MKAYEGKKPYAFVSYAHLDGDLVIPIIQGLMEQGFRVWYDAGVEVGNEWPDIIAEHLEECNCVVTMVSQNYTKSSDCRDELYYAKNLKKDIVVINLDNPVNIRGGVKLRLSAYHWEPYEEHDHVQLQRLLGKLSTSRVLEPCLE